MSGLAEILLDAGFTVSGSDAHETELTRHLTEKGARIYYGQRAANIEQEPGIQAVVYTAAIQPGAYGSAGKGASGAYQSGAFRGTDA